MEAAVGWQVRDIPVSTHRSAPVDITLLFSLHSSLFSYNSSRFSYPFSENDCHVLLNSVSHLNMIFLNKRRCITDNIRIYVNGRLRTTLCGQQTTQFVTHGPDVTVEFK